MKGAIAAIVIGTCLLISGTGTILFILFRQNGWFEIAGVFLGALMLVVGITLVVVGLVLFRHSDSNRSRARSVGISRPLNLPQTSYVAQPSQRPVLPSGYTPRRDQMTVSYSYVPPGHQSSHRGSRHHAPVTSGSPTPAGLYLNPTAPEGDVIAPAAPLLFQNRGGASPGSRGSWGDPRIVGPTAPEYQAPQPYNPEEDLPPPYSEVVKEGSYLRY